MLNNALRCLTTQEFVTYFQYVRSLKFDEKPGYAFLRRMFRDLFAKEGASQGMYLKSQRHWSGAGMG